MDCRCTELYGSRRKKVSVEDLCYYDTIIYGGGLYANVISGVSLITKNFDKLSDKNIFVFYTGITPLDCKEYYDDQVIRHNFKPYMIGKIHTYYFLGKMIMDELTLPHKAALKTLSKIMQRKENPTDMEKMLVNLCDVSVDLCDRSFVEKLVNDVKNL